MPTTVAGRQIAEHERFCGMEHCKTEAIIIVLNLQPSFSNVKYLSQHVFTMLYISGVLKCRLKRLFTILNKFCFQQY